MAQAKVPIAVSNGRGHVWDVKGARTIAARSSSFRGRRQLSTVSSYPGRRTTATRTEDLRRLDGHAASGVAAERLSRPAARVATGGGRPTGRERQDGIRLLLGAGTDLRGGTTELAILVDDSAAHRRPNDEETLAAEESRSQEIAERKLQSYRFEMEHRSHMMVIHKHEIEAARARKRNAMEREDGLGQFGVHAPEPTRERPEVEPTAERLARQGYFVSVPHRSDPSKLPWYKPDLHFHSTLESARAAGIWSYPSTPIQKARCGVFRALWEQGKYMGGGLKFGCDFLVYPGQSCDFVNSRPPMLTHFRSAGDSLRYHSHFACTVVPSLETTINPLDLVSMGRLATAVKKAHLLAAWDDAKQEATFMSLEWAGIG